jgi:SAM-dependent methyltransferase
MNKRFAEESLRHIDAAFLPGTSQEVDFLERVLGVRAGDSILDLGCGAGRHAIEFASRGYKVVGIDVSPWLLQVARERAAEAGVEVKCLQGDLANLQVLVGEDAAFDGAISICESGLGVLGGWRDDLRFLKAVKAVLKPKGVFVLTTYNGLRRYRKWREGDERFCFVEGIQKWETPPDWGGERLTEKERLYIPSEIRMLFEMAGFGEVEVHGCAPGRFFGQALQIDDVEMMVIGRA